MHNFIHTVTYTV